jgi:N4-gp56 family major capsid protein
MAKTSFSTSNALTKKAWDEKINRDISKESYFSKFQGTTKDSLVQVTTEVEKNRGDQVTFGLRMRLTSPGVTSGQQLENNEERLTTHSFSVSLEQYRHAVRDAGEMDRKRAMFSIDEESEQAIKTWGAEKLDQLHFDAIGVGVGATTDPTKIFYRNSSGTVLATGTPATAKTALDATNSRLNNNIISALKTWAKTGGGRSYVPIRPIKIDGKEYYVLLVHPDCLFDLKVNDSVFQNAQRDAQERGKDNPLFAGATAIWDGVVIHEHENCAIATDGGGASVAWSKAVFMGAQSLVLAQGKRGTVIKKEFDYDNENGYAYSMICKVGKPVYNSLDFGSIGVYLSRTNVSGL